DLIGYFAPIREPRRDQHARASRWQKVCYRIWCGDVVVNEQPCRALLSKPTQPCLRSLLKISFFRRCSTQSDSKGRKSTEQPKPGLSRTPTHARIQTSEAVRILNG